MRQNVLFFECRYCGITTLQYDPGYIEEMVHYRHACKGDPSPLKPVSRFEIDYRLDYIYNVLEGKPEGV